MPERKRDWTQAAFWIGYIAFVAALGALVFLVIIPRATGALAVVTQSASTGYKRCAVVDPHANKIVEVKQGSGDTIVKVIGYVDQGGSIKYEAPVWDYAKKLVTGMKGTTLRERCVS